MLAIIRVLKNLRNREHHLRTRYHRQHPHFLLYVALDAIITVAIFGGGYTIASSHGILERNPAVLADLGAKQLDVGGLVAQAKEHGVEMFWVGPKVGFGYTSALLSSSKVTVNYFNSNTSRIVADEPFLSVETYSDPSKYAVTTKGHLHPTEDVSVINDLGHKVTYNPTDLSHATVENPDGTRLFVIRYADPQTESGLLQASENLRLVM